MKNLHQLTCKFDLDQSELKSKQVHARPGQTESKVDLSFQLASMACESVWSEALGKTTVTKCIPLLTAQFLPSP